MKETWKSIRGYKGLYEVSNLGKVRSFGHRCGGGRFKKRIKILNPCYDDSGYLGVKLYKGGHGKSRRVEIQSLVLTTFRRSRPKGKESSHLDGNSSNNKLSNLRWETKSKNQRRRVEHGTDTRGEKCANAKLTNKDVIKIRKLRDAGCTLQSIANKMKVTAATVSLITRRKLWRHLR